MNVKLPALSFSRPGRDYFVLQPAPGLFVEAKREVDGDYWRIERVDERGVTLPGYPRFYSTRADAEMFVNHVLDEDATA